MAEYTSRDQYESDLAARAAFPPGFRVSTTNLSFVPAEKTTSAPLAMNMALVLPIEPTALFAATFTRNAFPGWPVVIGRERLEQPLLNGLLINNRIANVNTQGGREDVEGLTDTLAQLTGRPAEGFLASSTGIIGWRLPVQEMKQSLSQLVEGEAGETALPLARAIMTTDSFPKIRGLDLPGGGRILGVAKGAGMIEPNMATLLVFLFTDARLSRGTLRSLLPGIVEESFNRITVDSDQSTSDTVILMSTGVTEVEEEAFRHGLLGVCSDLARDVVRNGEGTEHVIAVTVAGAMPFGDCLGLAKAVANSPLIKTAVAGNDPNVGRILMALGDYCGNRGIAIDRETVSFSIGDTPVYRDGIFVLDTAVEDRLSRYLSDCTLLTSDQGYPSHERMVDIQIQVGHGEGSATVYGSDLGHGYVTENADYRS